MILGDQLNLNAKHQEREKELNEHRRHRRFRDRDDDEWRAEKEEKANSDEEDQQTTLIVKVLYVKILEPSESLFHKIAGIDLCHAADPGFRWI